MYKLALTVAFPVFLASLPAVAAEVTGIEEKVRNSESVIIAEVTRVEPNLVVIKVGEIIKGGVTTPVKKQMRVGGEIEGGEEPAFKKGEKVLLFIGEVSDDIAILYGGLAGRLGPGQGDLNEFKGAVKAVLALDAASGKPAKTAHLRKMLAIPGFASRHVALQEVLVHSGEYDIAGLLPSVTPMLKDKSAKLRSKAMLAAVRIYDSKAGGTSREEALLKMLIGMLDDADEEVRLIAGMQLSGHSGNKKLTFDAKAPAEERKKAVDAWKKWLSERKPESVETEFE
jgi:hypothetical protein